MISGGVRCDGYKVGTVRGYSDQMQALVISVDRQETLLGSWWLAEMVSGVAWCLPVVNISPKMSPRSGCNSCKK